MTATGACRSRGDATPGATAEDTSRILWAADLIGKPSFSTAAGSSPGGVVYAASVGEPLSPPPGHGTTRGLLQVHLQAFDASGTLLGALGGTVVKMGHVPQVWLDVAPSGTAYAVDTDGGFYGIWPSGAGRFRALDEYLQGPLLIADTGRVYVGSSSGLLGLDLEATEVIGFSWTKHAGSAPAFGADGSFLVGTTHGGRTYAITAEGGERWARRLGAYRPAVGPYGNVYAISGQSLLAVNRDGDSLWEIDLNKPPVGPPMATPHGDIYVLTKNGALYSFDAEGRENWSLLLKRWLHPPGLGSDGLFYYSDRLGVVRRIDPGGVETTITRLPSVGGTPGLSADGQTLYVSAGDNRLYAIALP